MNKTLMAVHSPPAVLSETQSREVSMCAMISDLATNYVHSPSVVGFD